MDEHCDNIVTFEELIHIMLEATDKWMDYHYTKQDLDCFNKYFRGQINKHANHPYGEAYYQRRLAELKR